MMGDPDRGEPALADATRLPPGTRPRRVSQIAIVAHDVARATAFYRDVLGVPLLFEVPGPMAFFDCGGTRLMLARAETSEQERMSSVIYLDVEEIEAAYQRLVAVGVHFERAPHLIATLGTTELWMAFLRDSEGNLLALSSERNAERAPIRP